MKKLVSLPREAKAKWGQNFLRNPKILQKISDFAHIEKNDTVVEIGPGEGTLTQFLLEKAGKVIAVEKDEGLAEKLKERFDLEIITGDILDLPDYLLPTTNYSLVGNIPYYITGEIFRKFLQNENQPKSITFVIQKEVAERIIARDDKESVLSISIKAYGVPEFGGIIKAGNFVPAPKVDSAIIAVRNINKERFKDGKIGEKRFFEIVKMGFAHKRKLLIRNLGLEVEIFEKTGIPLNTRAENLTIDDWFAIMKVCHLEK